MLSAHKKFRGSVPVLPLNQSEADFTWCLCVNAPPYPLRMHLSIGFIEMVAIYPRSKYDKNDR
jgi:hypothetical protein